MSLALATRKSQVDRPLEWASDTHLVLYERSQIGVQGVWTADAFDILTSMNKLPNTATNDR